MGVGSFEQTPVDGQAAVSSTEANAGQRLGWRETGDIVDDASLDSLQPRVWNA